MGRRIISSLSRCDMCNKRDAELFAVQGMELCKRCKRTMQSCNNVRSPEQPKESGGFGPRWTVTKSNPNTRPNV